MYDWPDAGYFARKGLAAAGGEVVLPEELGNWDILEDHLQELADARTRLMAALDDGTREYNPEVAARAQGRFDCWVEQQEENHQPDHIAACRDAFNAAMMGIEGPGGDPAGTYVILFDFDRSTITDGGQTVINQILADIQARGGMGASATGHADRSGSEEYNLSLSLRRADAVREALIAGGVAADAITTAGRGESESAVPTADGVKEQANRRVAVIIQ
jgi:OOP family OmpA-OmpF porin